MLDCVENKGCSPSLRSCFFYLIPFVGLIMGISQRDDQRGRMIVSYPTALPHLVTDSVARSYELTYDSRRESCSHKMFMAVCVVYLWWPFSNCCCEAAVVAASTSEACCHGWQPAQKQVSWCRGGVTGEV